MVEEVAETADPMEAGMLGVEVAGGVVVEGSVGSSGSSAGRLRGVMDVAEEEWLLVVWGKRRRKVVLRVPREWRLGWKESNEVARADT